MDVLVKTMKTSIEKERMCETTFSNSGPYWHAYTSGKDMPIIFVNVEDFKFAMNLIAQSAAQYPSVGIIAFEVMNNHFHFVLCAEPEDIFAFWSFIARKLVRVFPVAKDISLSLKSIEDIHSLRNTIVYTHRNGYVANPNYTPFNYPWGSGGYYFIDGSPGINLSDMGIREIRKIFKCRTAHVPKDWKIKDAYVIPTSYCRIKFGISVFRDAHHYFSSLSKNVEAYSSIAIEIGDDEFLTDSELFNKISNIAKDKYGIGRIKDLTKAHRIELARILHYDFRSSNNQIRRLLFLTQIEIDSLFPLSSKRR